MKNKILLIDSSKYETQKIRLLLNKLGNFSISEIHTQADLENLLNTSISIDLFIIDIAFPIPEIGISFITKIRENPNFVKAPIIITTKFDNLEYRNAAAKLLVNDYIVKPYVLSRLENSLKSVIKFQKEFSYDTCNMQSFNLSFENFIEREIKLSSRTNQPLSLLFMSLIEIEKENEMHENIASSSLQNLIVNTLINTSIDILRSTDTSFLNANNDVIINLPGTTNSNAKLVLDKLVTAINLRLADSKIVFKDFYSYTSVTYPDDGETLQELLQSAFSKISNQNMIKQTSSISPDIRNYADKRYHQFKKWWF